MLNNTIRRISLSDLDNLLKFSLDALGVGRTFYYDDGQVSSFKDISKQFDGRYGGEGFTHVKVGTKEVIEIDD